MLNEVLPGGRKSCSALRSQASSPSLSNESPSSWTNFDYDEEGLVEKNNRTGGLIKKNLENCGKFIRICISRRSFKLNIIILARRMKLEPVLAKREKERSGQ